jgi:prepilin-type N-terminal cleavage/methylation domain-containing protein
MKKTTPSEYKARGSGFTLIEVVMVLVLIIIIASISLPTLSGSLKGLQLKTSSRTVRRAAKYARNMAIMREQTLTVALDKETMELYVGGYAAAQTNMADGEIDQDVLKRLGYVDGGESPTSSGGRSAPPTFTSWATSSASTRPRLRNVD